MRLPKFKSILRISILKTLYINFRLLPFRQAIFLPIWVSRGIYLESLSGKCVLSNKVKPALLKVGFVHSNFFYWKNRTYINIEGTLTLNGFVQMGVGTSLVIDKGAQVSIGDNVVFGSYNKIICRNNIIIGNNFRSAWEVQIFDTNFHYIKDTISGKVVYKSHPITIGSNNWIGNRSTVMPGTVTPDFFIVAANSLCNKNYSNLSSYTLVGGMPAKVIKNNVVRVLDREEKIIDSLFAVSKANELTIDPTPLYR